MDCNHTITLKTHYGSRCPECGTKLFSYYPRHKRLNSKDFDKVAKVKQVNARTILEARQETAKLTGVRIDNILAFRIK